MLKKNKQKKTIFFEKNRQGTVWLKCPRLSSFVVKRKRFIKETPLSFDGNNSQSFYFDSNP